MSSDFERAEIYEEISSHVDNIYEVLENNDIDVENDPYYAEIDDLLQRLSLILNGEE